MGKNLAAAGLCAILFAVRLLAQTPDQEKAWAADRERAAAVERAKAEQLMRDRAARKADPMSFVRSLDPMASGGWEFRSVGLDGSWAIYSSTHQFKRSGQVVTMWMRHEYAEPKVGEDGPYSSAVEKVQYDCKKQEYRNLLVIFYTSNNIQGSEQTEESDAKTTPWNAIVPGTPEESNFLWACAQARGGGSK